MSITPLQPPLYPCNLGLAASKIRHHESVLPSYLHCSMRWPVAFHRWGMHVTPASWHWQRIILSHSRYLGFWLGRSASMNTLSSGHTVHPLRFGYSHSPKSTGPCNASQLTKQTLAGIVSNMDKRLSNWLWFRAVTPMCRFGGNCS